MSNNFIMRFLRWVACLTIVLAVSAAVGLTVYGAIVKVQAEAILHDVSELTVGMSSQAEVRRLAAHHKSELTIKDCGPEQCTYFFEIGNRWLVRARIEPDARFQAWVTVDHNVIRSLHVWVMRDTMVFPTMSSGGIVEEYPEYPKRYRSDETHYGFPTPVGKPYLRVVLDSHATREQREHAYAFSLRCLIKPGGGCDLPCDYLPLAWKDWESELKQSASGFGDYYPNRARRK